MKYRNRLIIATIVSLSFLQTAYALPAPIFAMSYDILLTVVPWGITLFLASFFYLRRWVLFINVALLCIAIGVYIWIVSHTEGIIFFRYEYLFFWLLVAGIFLAYRVKYLHFLMLSCMIALNVIMSSIALNVYTYKDISTQMVLALKSEFPDVSVTHVTLRPGYVVFDLFDTRTKTIFNLWIQSQEKEWFVRFRWKTFTYSGPVTDSFLKLVTQRRFLERIIQ